jgi:hypothetical protein
LEVVDDLVGVDGHIPFGGVEVQVAQELGGDVDGQAAVDRLGGEQPPEVVGNQAQRLAVDVVELGSGDRPGDGVAGALVADDDRGAVGLRWNR